MGSWFYWGEKNNPANKGSEWRDIDPGKVRWHHNDLNEDAVKFYERNPNGRFDSCSGEPFVLVDKHGRMHGRNGRHRAEAARRSGRKLRARVVDERG